jgi:hypothetical protein
MIAITDEMKRTGASVDDAPKKRASGSGHINLVELLEADIRLRAELG